MYQFELNPFRTKEVERMFDAFSRANAFAPACEILDEEKSYKVSLDIPGLSKDEIEIEVKDNSLLISGERKEPAHTEKSQVTRSEKRYGKFSRVFTLPKDINSEGIEASFENGVLLVSLPKEEKVQARKIAITSAH